MKSSYYGLVLVAALATPAAGQEVKGFDPTRSCVEALSNAGGSADRHMLAAWVLGYLAAQDGTIRPVTEANNQVILKNLTKACIETGGAPVIELVMKSRPAAADPASADTQPQAPAPGREAEARARLEAFLDPAADRAALTWALKPTEADIRAVYGEPLATRLIAAYGEMFTPEVSIGPKDGQTEVLMWYATTQELREGKPILQEFPGGYEKAAPLMQGAHPIVRFKFAEPGETLGLAFDGLIFVNDHWVLMPKPWRFLD